MTQTLTPTATLPGITAAGACDGCGYVLPATALAVIDEAEHWSAMSWDRGYVRCEDCRIRAEAGTAVEIREQEVADLAAALAENPFYRNLNHAEQARQMLGYDAPDGDELL